MGRICALMVLVLALAGCGRTEVMEYVTDEPASPVVAEPAEIRVDLPEDSVMPAMESDTGKIYICEDYDVSLQTMERGNLDATVRSVSGFGTGEVTLIQTGWGDVDRYEFVWTSAGERGQQVGRATILDDGNYHYVLSALIRAEKMAEYQEVWNGIFESFHLVQY